MGRLLSAKLLANVALKLTSAQSIQEEYMRRRVSPFILPALVSGIACQRPVDTLPPPVSPTAAVQYYDLEVPPDLEIKAVDFSAATFSDVSGAGGTTTSTVGGRAFVKVYAVHRTTGEQFLLLYEDIARRRRPVQVIRFLRGADGARPDSPRSRGAGPRRNAARGGRSSRPAA